MSRQANDHSGRASAEPPSSAAKRAAESAEGPGLWWQLWEFFGLTWPARYQTRDLTPPPRCAACHNPARRTSPEAEWRCPNHPNAALLPADERA